MGSDVEVSKTGAGQRLVDHRSDPARKPGLRAAGSASPDYYAASASATTSSRFRSRAARRYRRARLEFSNVHHDLWDYDVATRRCFSTFIATEPLSAIAIARRPATFSS